MEVLLHGGSLCGQPRLERIVGSQTIEEGLDLGELVKAVILQIEAEAQRGSHGEVAEANLGAELRAGDLLFAELQMLGESLLQERTPRVTTSVLGWNSRFACYGALIFDSQQQMLQSWRNTSTSQNKF